MRMGRTGYCTNFAKVSLFFDDKVVLIAEFLAGLTVRRHRGVRLPALAGKDVSDLILTFFGAAPVILQAKNSWVSYEVTAMSHLGGKGALGIFGSCFQKKRQPLAVLLIPRDMPPQGLGISFGIGTFIGVGYRYIGLERRDGVAPGSERVDKQLSLILPETREWRGKDE